MGRPRKPTALKLLHGDEKARINAKEPVPQSGLGEPPGHLDDEGRRAWQRLASILEPMRVVGRSDADLVGIYAQNYSVWIRAVKLINSGDLLSGNEEWLRANPVLGIMNQAQAQMVKILCQLGMTPAARSLLHADAGPKQDQLADLLSRRTPRPDAKKNTGS